jgi:glycosyltransferase involved in cell wall biosynthesis
MIPVSVIIPCYRCSDSVGRAVNSVTAQTVPPAEVILVDDASGDQTLEALQTLRDNLAMEQVRVIGLKQHGGPGAARNAGWEMASQPYLAFLDADDAWHPRKLEIQYGWMARHPEVMLTGHPCVWLRDGRNGPPVDAEPEVSLVDRWRILRSNPLQTPSVMLKTDAPFRFPADMRFAEDYLLWCRLVLAGLPAQRLETTLAYLHKPAFGAGGLSARLWAMEAGELEVYRRLQREQLISMTLRALLTVWSLVRYLRRLLVFALRRSLMQRQ